jgi:hypothetical protein
MNNKKPAKKVNQPVRDDHPPLSRQNYMLILIGFGIIILGCLLMIGNTNIYDFRKTVLAPVIVVFGFVFEIYAIMKRPRTNAGTDTPA